MMKKLCRFMLLIGYVIAVLLVTTVEVKAYISREKGQQTLKEDAIYVASVAEPIIDGAAAETYEEQAINETETGDTDISEGEEDSENTDLGDTGIVGDTENPENTVLGDTDIPEDTEDSENIDFFDIWKIASKKFLVDFSKRNETKDSYEITLEVNQADKECIMENKYDFSNMKIACLGDSVTAASNLDEEENYEQYSYPSILKELLGVEEVYNLGIGGSSIGRYWLEPFVERYTEIPEDTDIIIIMGGYNDGFCGTETEFGSMEEREYNTFCGDLDELMRGLKEDYPDAVVFFATPMPSSLHSFLMSLNENLIAQEEYVKVIGALSEEYGFEFLDLYNLGILDSHDDRVADEYIPDGVHGTPAGYQVMAEHFASEIVKYFNAGIEEQEKMEEQGEMEEKEKIENQEEIEEDERGISSIQ